MQSVRVALTAAFLCGASTPVLAVEGSSAAGPIGGSDVRSAQLPPPGLYGGAIFLGATAFNFADIRGHTIPALAHGHLTRFRAGPFLIYVPEVQVFGGAIGVAGIVPLGEECGRLFATTTRQCMQGMGDPYVEVAWSRFFGTVRPSKFPGAYPILEGLAVLLGFGMVIPAGTYDANLATMQGLTIGNNIWDFAPSIAFTFTSKPMIAEGTEVSAKLYWNNYLINPATQYLTGTVLNLDFAISERIGRFQVGMAGFYAYQTEGDKQFGLSVPPDGRRGEVLQVGPVLVYDMPEVGSSVKVKALTTAVAGNTVWSNGVVVGFIKKLY